MVLELIDFIINLYHMYQTYERQKSRDRSRDRKYNRSPSEDDDHRKHRKQDIKPKGKRVKFEESPDVRIFRKQDEPSARGLSDEDINKIKAQIQKQIAKSYDFNWEHYKHRDALSESNSMKEQKQKEKALSEKLMSVRECMGYVCPPLLVNIESIIKVGSASTQKWQHSRRIQQILGCYYTHVSQIPNQPQFQILNTNSSTESKLIKFDNDTFNEQLSFGNSKKQQETQKPIKGILKIPNLPTTDRKSEPRFIDPQLIYLLKDFKLNPTKYNKETTEQLLKPFKISGELDYLMKNKEVLETMLRNTATSNPTPNIKPQFPLANPIIRDSSDRQPSQTSGTMPIFNHTFVPKADKFRTVPCKYYHSQQGCSKTDNCTFIHDQKFAGQSVPSGSSMPRETPTNGRMPYNTAVNMPFTGYPPMNNNMTMPMTSGMPPTMNTNYYNQPGTYPPNRYPPSNYQDARGNNPQYQGGYGMGQTNNYGQAQQTNQYNQGPTTQYPGQQGGQYPQPQTGGQFGQTQPQYQNPVPTQQPYIAGQYGMAPQGYSNPNYQYYMGQNPPPSQNK